MHLYIRQHYLAIGRRFLDAIMLWSNPDRAWITASLVYLRNLCDLQPRLQFFEFFKHPAVTQIKNPMQVTKIAKNFNPQQSLPAKPPEWRQHLQRQL